MNVNWGNHIEDASKIEPKQIITYLQKHQWIKKDVLWPNKPDIEIYQKIVDGGLYQVNIPTSRRFSDYDSAMLRAVVEIINSQEADRVRQLTAKILKTGEK
jgi:hypothetical protein